MARRDRALEEDAEPIVAAEDSLLVRSAESLGRVIGSLQRELDNAARHLFKADNASRRNGTAKPAARRIKTVRKRATKNVVAASTTRSAKPQARAKKKTATRKAVSRKK